MNQQPFCRRACALVVGAALLACGGWASADPPSRIARLGYASGAVTFSPAGEDDWVEATINRPMGTGDRLWTDARARAEIQVGGAMIHMDAVTSVSVLSLDDRTTQVELTQGTLNVRVRRLDADEVFEVDTPNLAFAVQQPGDYRIEVDPDGNSTTIIVRGGRGEVYGENASYVIDSRQPYRFTGTGLREYEVVDAPRLDEFDRWSGDRDHALDNSGSARYVSQDVVGYQDLDANGTWRVDADHGNVWIPNRVAADWAPYRDGHWAWVDPWGWTWVDAAPWGFAVSHYGRWANLGGTWGWVPGPVRSRAYYAPALVVFVGGANLQLTITSGNVGGVAWFPLAPREVYRPSYTVSRGYFENVNQSNTVINNTVIVNIYNNTNVTNVVYANRQVPGAVVAVPTTAFVQSQPVSRAAMKLSEDVLASRPVSVAPPVAPTEKSVRGAAAQRDKPPARVFERPVVARTAPPAAHIGFAAQQQQLAAKPGPPLDDAARRELGPSGAAPAAVVKVVAPPQARPTAIVAPPTTSAARPAAAGTNADERKPVAAPPRATPRAPVAQAADPAGNSEPRGRPEQRGQPVEAPPPPARPQVAPPGAREVPPPMESGHAEPRGKADAPRPPVAEPAARVARPAQAAAPAPPAAQAPQRARPDPAPAAKQAEPRPLPTAARPPPPQRQPEPTAQSRAPQPGPAASRPADRKKDGEEPKRDEEGRKQRG